MTAQQGGSFKIAYNWQAVPMAGNYRVFVHFIDSNGNVRFYGDHAPPVPTSTWSGPFSYTRWITVPSSVPTGTYQVVVGLYSYDSSTGTYTDYPLATGTGVTTYAADQYQTGTLTVSASQTAILQNTPASMTAQPGGSFNITYNWNAVPMAGNYTVFVHFIDSNGNVQFYGDHAPPVLTSAWSGPISYTRTVTVPPTVPAGTYRIVAGLYFYNSLTGTYTDYPLATGAGVTTYAADQYQIGTVTVSDAQTTILQNTPASMTAQPGGSFNITYNWYAAPMAGNYTVFVHFIDSNGNIQFQDDHTPSVPTSAWSGPISYTRTVTVPSTLPTGTYRVVVGLYSYNSSTGAYTDYPLATGAGVTTYGTDQYQTGTLAVSAATGTTSLSPPAGYTTSQLIFDDQFSNSTLNTNNWNPWIGNDQYGRWSDKGNLPSPYSGMNEPGAYQIMYYDPYPAGDSTNISGQHLVTGTGLREIASPSSYFSNLGYSWVASGISSYGKVYLPATGGYVQFLAKMPDSTHGAWAGLWFLSKGGSAAEMDLQESGYPAAGAPNANYVLASHWQGPGGNQVIQNTGVDLSAAYHIYGIEYNPGQWWKVYLDGKLMASWINGVNGVVIPNDAYEILIDLEFAGSTASPWHTIANATSYPGPFEFDVREVQIYKLP
jgi:hypothetical protein